VKEAQPYRIPSGSNGLALASSLLKGEKSLVVRAAKQVRSAVARRDLELAHELLRDLAWRNRSAFDDFMARYASDLPDEAREELQRL
jgi:hypothetical protein